MPNSSAFNQFSVNRILILKLGALGDFVLALGAMRVVRQQFPAATITLMTRPPLQELVAGAGLVDRVVFDPHPRKIDPLGWWRVRRLIRMGDPELVIDFQNNDRTSWYRFLSRQGRGGPSWSGKASGCQYRFRPPVPLTHASDWQKAQLAALGLPAPDVETLSWLTGTPGGFGLPVGRYVLLVPGCAPHRAEKRWPAERYARLAREIAAEGVVPVVLGTAGEAVINQRIADLCPAVVDLTGQTRLVDLPALARGALAAVGNDTGPMHLIGPTGCPALVLFSRHSSAQLSRPLGPAVSVMRREELTGLSVEDVRTWPPLSPSVLAASVSAFASASASPGSGRRPCLSEIRKGE
jgi:ADP-heptose:LPS heptosyltransferase